MSYRSDLASASFMLWYILMMIMGPLEQFETPNFKCNNDEILQIKIYGIHSSTNQRKDNQFIHLLQPKNTSF